MIEYIHISKVKLNNIIRLYQFKIIKEDEHVETFGYSPELNMIQRVDLYLAHSSYKLTDIPKMNLNDEEYYQVLKMICME
ncbi:hypothetical protein [Citrobacter farmeri]|uniref:hypothetical protein n=1 Tax=Citrobacter farmeri TaxID=67824 RepID=UPI0018FF5C7D|nr:hypothetical protein [Citrobacter farmeri]MBJ9134409.1 hypothetical protein [Citrobacter farmeri]